MYRHHFEKLLIVVLLVLFVSNLMADKVKQQQLETTFRADTAFEGTITWWDDDTFKGLEGYFPNTPVYFDDDPEDIEYAMDDIFRSLLPYTGLKDTDFFSAVEDYDAFTYNQKLNGKYLVNVGYLEIYMNDNDELTITVYTMPKVSAPEKESISLDEAYNIFKNICDQAELVPQTDTKAELVYISTQDDKDIVLQKPANLSLAWLFHGKEHAHYIDAVTGKLINK
jgi:hypothetical protein